MELVFAAGVAGTILAFGWIATRKGCGPEAFLCEKDIVREYPSPSGKKKFVFFYRGCAEPGVADNPAAGTIA